MRALCDEHDVLLIADEIATGFGRTGRMFACEHAGVAPDILCVGKALTGGTLSLAATLVSGAVARGDRGAASRACSCTAPRSWATRSRARRRGASLDLLGSAPWRERVARSSAGSRAGSPPARALRGVADVRVLGAIGVVELDEPVDMAVVQPAFVDAASGSARSGGSSTRCRRTSSSPPQLERITRAICEVIEHAYRRSGTPGAY